MSVSFRQVDIDKYDVNSPVNVLPEPTQVISDYPVDALKQAVRPLISSGKSVEALATVFESPPYGLDDETKNAVAVIVLEVLSAFRVSEIESAIKQMDKQQRTVLTKYLYKLSSMPEGKANGTVILNWMEKTLQVAGESTIVRHITDRRTV